MFKNLELGLCSGFFLWSTVLGLPRKISVLYLLYHCFITALAPYQLVCSALEQHRSSRGFLALVHLLLQRNWGEFVCKHLHGFPGLHKEGSFA